MKKEETRTEWIRARSTELRLQWLDSRLQFNRAIPEEFVRAPGSWNPREKKRKIVAKQSERLLIFEEVRKAQSRLNRVAGVEILTPQDKALYTALTTWQQEELGNQQAALGEV